MIIDISNPYFQSVICCGLMFLLVLVSGLDVGMTLSSGMWIGTLFLLGSLFYGVYFDRTWLYLMHLLAAAIAFSAFWVLLAVLANTFGEPIRNGEGWMILIAPVTFFPALFAFALISKLIFDFIRSLFV